MPDKVWSPEQKAALEAAAEVFASHGIDISLPWECDLDDLERERFDALDAALEAAWKAMKLLRPDLPPSALSDHDPLGR